MLIIKIGGGTSINIEGIIRDLSELNEQFIIIHGANSLRDNLAQALGKPKKVLTSIKGYSSVYSDKDAIELLYMAYAGLGNKRIVETCQKYSINAVGLTGLDGRLIQGKRNSGIRVIENGKKKIKHDLSGKPRSINKELLSLLLENGYTPVITVPIIDENNNTINSENDDIVALFQETLKVDTIIFLIEAPGLLEDPRNNHSVRKKLSITDLEKHKENASGRIKRKYYALRKISQLGPKKIIISDGRIENPIQGAFLENGTVISNLG